VGANSHSLQATTDHFKPQSVQVNGPPSHIRRHAAMVLWCLLSLIAAAVALP